jgi:ribosomal protein S18 acetylase RimI-like enzyme
MEITRYIGPRECLAPLFAEADDSESEIASYINLGEVFVARENGNIVGHVQVVETAESGILEIKSLAVDESRRSNGIGSTLVGAALADCRERDAHTVLVATAAASIGALQFYQRQGFRIRQVIRDFYSASRGYRPLMINGIPLLDEVILDIALR